MTPKQKAQEIFNKFYLLNEKTDSCFGLCDSESFEVCDKVGNGCGLWREHAKNSASMCIDEIIEFINANDTGLAINAIAFHDRFYTSVKQELIKL